MWGIYDERRIQACIPELQLDWVKNITEFTARQNKNRKNHD